MPRLTAGRSSRRREENVTTSMSPTPRSLCASIRVRCLPRECPRPGSPQSKTRVYGPSHSHRLTSLVAAIDFLAVVNPPKILIALVGNPR